MVRNKLKKSKKSPSLVRSLSSMILGSSKTTGGVNTSRGHSSADTQRKGFLPQIPKKNSSVLQSMQRIIQSQQDEITKHLDASSDLRREMKASEKRVELLKDTVEDFANALYSSRDETRELDRQRRKLAVENRKLREEKPSKPLAQSIAAYTVQQQAASYEREMRALVSQIAVARDDVAQHYSDISGLNNTLATITVHSGELARQNELLSQNNAELCRRIAELESEGDTTSFVSISASNGTDFTPEGRYAGEDQPVVKELDYPKRHRPTSGSHKLEHCRYGATTRRGSEN